MNLAHLGDKYGRIAGPALGLRNRNIDPGQPFGGFDDLADGVALAGPDIDGSAFNPAVPQGFQGQDMDIRQVKDMDVIPDAGPVRRLVIRPEDLDLLPLAQGSLKGVAGSGGFHFHDVLRWNRPMPLRPR